LIIRVSCLGVVTGLAAYVPWMPLTIS